MSFLLLGVAYLKQHQSACRCSFRLRCEFDRGIICVYYEQHARVVLAVHSVQSLNSALTRKTGSPSSLSSLLSVMTITSADLCCSLVDKLE